MWTGTKDEAPVNLRGGPGAKVVINLEEDLVRKYRHVTLVTLQGFFFFFSKHRPETVSGITFGMDGKVLLTLERWNFIETKSFVRD